jgi:NAD(P)-dependent dehydrogenase (short-subunit alcohol dehydrogenase family)
MARLAGKRALVVGASSGIGRAIAMALCSEGARVAFAARRRDRLEAAVAESGSGAVAIECDVREPASCERAVAQTVAQLGGIDALVFSAGWAVPVPLAEAGAELWTRALETHVRGPALLTRAALPHLSQSRGRALYVSSIAAEDRPPRAGMALYVVGKAALDRMIEAWQGEHRDVGFTRLQVGDTSGTEFADGWPVDDLQHYVPTWHERGYLFGRMMEPERVAEQVIAILTNPEFVPSLTLIPRWKTD